jgi:hypothetical protein
MRSHLTNCMALLEKLPVSQLLKDVRQSALNQTVYYPPVLPILSQMLLPIALQELLPIFTATLTANTEGKSFLWTEAQTLRKHLRSYPQAPKAPFLRLFAPNVLTEYSRVLNSLLTASILSKVACLFATVSACMFDRSERRLFVSTPRANSIVSMKNDVFWDVTPCGSCKNRQFG